MLPDEDGTLNWDQDRLGALLDAPPLPVTEAEAEALAEQHFGQQGQAVPLGGERDRNFHLRAGDEAGFVLKVIHPAEDAAVSAFHSLALEHLARSDPSLPVPRLHRPVAGPGTEAIWQPEGRPACRLRLLDYLPGRPLHLTAPGPAQRRAVGACLARLDLAFQGFTHPAERHPLMWDIQHALRLRGFLAHLPQVGDRGVAAAMLDRFERHVLPVLPRLRMQVIHNDFNPHNILADPADDAAIAGIIDFGDMVRAPLVQDLATACAYQMQPEGHPLAAAAELAQAFHAHCPLQPEEIAILADLIGTRLTVSVAISSWRAARQPENASYILRNYNRALSGLRRLGVLPRDEAQRFLKERLAA
ncbi:phosphotransferase [Teichococcus oryzae]|uniref:Hydroxylysine kinase n=1 Tax=Teichococcus oryzae TaxID=1608942 RepID=A0A5B2TMY8_9PROT|nr:phosphotransferase [Pseudoroseomonas oryzae]KAA2215050.1 phosphotransferase [Pseudoroseomonas oryzae]